MAVWDPDLDDDDADEEGDSVQLTYFEIYEYDEPELEELAASFDAASTVDTESSSIPLELDEQTLDDSPCALWPPLERSSYDPSCRDSNLSEATTHLDPYTSLEESAAALLAISPSPDGAAGLAKAGLALCEREANRSGSCSSAGDLLSMNQALARRSIAATVLTQGCERHGGAPPLPMLPSAVAREILQAALPLEKPLALFASGTQLETGRALCMAQLQLSMCNLDADGAGVVAWLLRHNGNLRELDLSANPLGATGASIIAAALPAAHGLQSLAMSGVMLCSAGGTDPSALATLAAALDQLPALEQLELRDNALGASGTAGLHALCTAIARPGCPLRVLDLRSNAIDSTGGAVVAVALLQSDALEELYLGGNQLTGRYGKAREGVRALAVALALNSSLRVLDLSSNAIGSRSSESMDQWHRTPSTATVHLVRALEQNATLRQLQLGGNHLVGTQGEALAQAWKRHPRDQPISL